MEVDAGVGYAPMQSAVAEYGEYGEYGVQMNQKLR